MTYTGLFEEGKELAKRNRKIKKLKDRIKDLETIEKFHKELNGKLMAELELEKKNHTLTREDVQAKDLEIARMMEKLNRKDS